ncbi:MAG: TonB-dependent siderophore receptor [Duganella sp.]
MPFRPLTFPLRPAPVTLAVLAAVAVTAVAPARAQSAAPSAARSATPAGAAAQKTYQIPAGTLTSVLGRFAASAGVALSFDPGITAGRNSSGLQGEHSVASGFASLLAGSGLQAVASDGGYVLQKAGAAVAADGGAAPVSVLPLVTVQAQDPGNLSEGSGAYTLGASSTATKLSLSLRETPQSISVITRQRMDDQNLNTVASVLEQTPGINIQHIDSERFSIFSRGYGIDSYQFDGVPTTLVITTTATPQSTGDMALYDHIDVLRGAAGLMTGAGEPSGTINLVRKRPTATFQASAAATLGSWQMRRAEVDVAGPLTDDGKVRGRVVAAHQQSDSFIDYYTQKKQLVYGIVEADLAPSTQLSAGVDYTRSDPRGVSFASFPLFYADGGQTDFDRSVNPASRWSSRKQDTLNAFATLEHRLPSDWLVKLSLNHLYSKRTSKQASASWGFPDRATGAGMMLFGGAGLGWQRQEGVDVQVQGPFELFGRRHEVVAGFNYAKFDDRSAPDVTDVEGRAVNFYTWDGNTAEPSPAELLLNNDTNIRQNGAYLATRLKPADDLSVIVGARTSNYRYHYTFDYVQPDRTDQLTEYRASGEVTPYAGVVYNVTPGQTLYASYTSIFKPQSVRDRTGAGLAPREGKSYEAGWKSDWLDRRATSAVALFETRQDNLAERDPGQVVPGSLNQPAYLAVKGARTRGIDLELSGQLAPGWNINTSFSHSTTEDNKGERIGTAAPANLFKLWTTYRLPGSWRGLTVGGGANWQSSMHFSATPWQLGKTVTARQDAYIIANLMARYQFNHRVALTVNVSNLFDKTYLSSLDTTFYGGYFGDPRNVSASLRYQF